MSVCSKHYRNAERNGFSLVRSGPVKRGVLLLALVGATAANADCTALSSFVLDSAQPLEEEQTFVLQVKRFCRGYTADVAGIDSPSFEMGYRYLNSVLPTQTDSSVASLLASRYCSAANTSEPAERAYQFYLQQFSDETYPLYNQCNRMDEAGISVSLDPASVLPATFSMQVDYQAESPDSNVHIKADPSSGVTCEWLHGAGKSIVLHSGQQTLLDCVRNDPTQAAYIRIYKVSGTQLNMLTLPWHAEASSRFAVPSADKADAKTPTVKEAGESPKPVILDQSMSSDNPQTEASKSENQQVENTQTEAESGSASDSGSNVSSNSEPSATPSIETTENAMPANASNEGNSNEGKSEAEKEVKVAPLPEPVTDFSGADSLKGSSTP